MLVFVKTQRQMHLQVHLQMPCTGLYPSPARACCGTIICMTLTELLDLPAAALLGLALGVLFCVLYVHERRRRVALGGQLVQAHQSLRDHLANDPLTGLLTRAGYDTQLRERVLQASQDGGGVCVLYVALDHFGALNDAFGRQQVDEVLHMVASRLRTSCPADATLGHISAGEFAVAVRGDLRLGRQLARQITDAMASTFELAAVQTTLSCAIGVAAYPAHGAGDHVLNHAALAMRRVKQDGGGGFREYDLSMGVTVREQTLLLNDLRQALALNQFELYFQPKVDARSLQVTAAEALLRWHHPERGLVSPGVFIPLAERHGLIGAIGNWVLEEACRTAAQWLERGLRMRVAVNFSGY